MNAQPGRRAPSIPDMPYGSDPKQKLDVYMPANPRNAPVIFMTHGGGWHTGDKRMANVVDNKLDQWGDRFIMVFPNYRLDLSVVTPQDQLHDVVQAYHAMDAMLPQWGGNRRKVYAMGHSAGAHLTTLMSVKNLTSEHAAIILDSAAYNIPEIMDGQHPSIYDDAFGSSAAFQRAMSPTLQLHGRTVPMLLVTRTGDEPGQLPEAYRQTNEFYDKARRYYSDVTVLPEALSHGDINGTLGAPSEYTSTVDRWIREH